MANARAHAKAHAAWAVPRPRGPGSLPGCSRREGGRAAREEEGSVRGFLPPWLLEQNKIWSRIQDLTRNTGLDTGLEPDPGPYQGHWKKKSEAEGGFRESPRPVGGNVPSPKF